MGYLQRCTTRQNGQREWFPNRKCFGGVFLWPQWNTVRYFFVIFSNNSDAHIRQTMDDWCIGCNCLKKRNIDKVVWQSSFFLLLSWNVFFLPNGSCNSQTDDPFWLFTVKLVVYGSSGNNKKMYSVLIPMSQQTFPFSKIKKTSLINSWALDGWRYLWFLHFKYGSGEVERERQKRRIWTRSYIYNEPTNERASRSSSSVSSG
jgi:hypothetical protein